MTKTVDEAINDLVAEINADEAATKEKKKTVNSLCTVVGREPIYSISDESDAVPTQIRSDQFYGQPLAASVRTILEMRKHANKGAASINEIHEALVAGGHQFQTKNEEVARNSLRNSLAKNTAQFHKLPNGRFGLVHWYPKVKGSKGSSSGTEANEADGASSETEE